MKLTLEEIKVKTLEAFGSTDSQNVDHITDELLASYADAVPLPELEAFAGPFYGHSTVYSWNEQYQEYCYYYVTDVKGSTSPGCGTGFKYFLRHSLYNIARAGDCTGSDRLDIFTRK